MGCLFCGIIEGKIPSRKAYEDERMVAFHDINPQAPTHLLLVPRKHVTSLLELEAGDESLVGGLVSRGRDLAREMGIAERGFRLVFNCGDDAGYSVHHIHLHLLGGRPLAWPPG
jgi:histidine triad (HIT) family protein